jgi:hypothetical protein
MSYLKPLPIGKWPGPVLSNKKMVFPPQQEGWVSGGMVKRNSPMPASPVEFLAPEDSDNSGIFVRFPNPGNDPWVAVKKGYEIQICGNESHKNKTGAIYDIQPAIDPGMKVGEWNTYNIITAGDQIAIILNGKLINVYECQDGRGDVGGYFGLQNHDDGSPVQFRKVKVRELASGSLWQLWANSEYHDQL